MDWSKGLEARYYATYVDVTTWRDRDRLEILGGTVSRSASELKESADFQCSTRLENERWIRVWLDATQNGETEHIALFTGLATSPKTDNNGNVVTNTLECYSVLKPLNDVLLERGWYAPSGSGASVVKDLLSKTPAPYIIDDNMPVLKDYIIAESGETNLSMLNKILLALNWRIKITGKGEIHICPLASDVSEVFGLDNDCIETEFTKEFDWYQSPNVFRAMMNDDSVIIKDEESILRRGREIWAEEESCNLNAGETLYEYASRRLKESQKVSQKVSYTRRFNPELYVTDYVRFNYEQLDGVYVITSQKIQLGYGADTTEEVRR